MTLRAPQAVRLLTVFGLFAALPVIAFGQRFIGSQGSQRGANVQAQQPPPAQTPTATPGAPGQRPQNQGPASWEWWKDDAIKKELRLTEKQVRDIGRIYDARVRDMKPIDDEFQKQRAQQETMARERTVDVALFAIQVNRVEGLRMKLAESRNVMLYAISRQLTTEQHTALGEIFKRRFASGRRGGLARW